MNDQQSSLEATIRRLRTKIRDIQNRASTINEQNTKIAFINPLMVALGWDIENLDEVSCEYKKKPQDNPVDYALFLLRTPCLFVEAKSLGSNLSDRKWITQTLSYASVVGVEWCVLTDGNEYKLYNAAALVDAEEKLFRTVCIADESQHQRTLETLQLLSKARMTEKGLSVLWTAHFVDRRVKAALENLIKGQDGSLVRLLRKEIDGLTASELRSSLQRADIRIVFPEVANAISTLSKAPEKPEKIASLSTTTKHARKSPVSVPVSIEDLIRANLISVPFEIETTYIDVNLKAAIREDGAVVFEGQAYLSLSECAGMARNSVKGPPSDGRKFYQTNGWTFWKYRDERTGKLVEIDELRKKYLALKS
jgi:hypothetical protein